MKAWVLVFLCLCSCHFGSKEKERLEKNKACITINIMHDPLSLDPRKTRGLNERTLVNMLFEGLMRMDLSGEVTPALAEKVEISSDLKTYTFHLRDAVWSNGDPIRSQNFVYAWQTALDPSFPSENAYQMYPIKNAKAVKMGSLSVNQLGVYPKDDKTLVVELEHPTPYFLELLTFSVFFPVHDSLDRKYSSEADLLSHFVSSGPFLLASWKHNDYLEVEKNPLYWDANTVKAEKIKLLMVQEDTEIKLFESKQIDWSGSPLTTLSVDVLEGFKKMGMVHVQPMLGTYFFRMNIEKVPFQHPMIRKAFAMALDRNAIITHVTQGNQVPAVNLVPPMMGLQTEASLADHDVENAKVFFQNGMQEIGLTLHTFPPVTLLYAANQRNHLIAQAVQQQWQEVLGVCVKLEAVEAKVYFDRLKSEQYQMASGSWIADFNDPLNFLEVFKYGNGSTNNTKWESGEYIALLQESNKIATAEKRRVALSRCEKILIDEMPLIPLYHMSMVYMKNERLKNVVMSPLGNLDFKWAYLENGG